MERNELILSLREKGMTQQNIAIAVGVSRQRVYQILTGKNTKSTVDRALEFARKRDDYKCQFCWSEKNIEVHHLDRNRKNNDPKNMLTLCRKCHREFHQKRNCEKR